MSGTKIGGLKASVTNKKRHGADYYARIGKRGGENGHTGGFAARVECKCDLISGTHIIANCAGIKGGLIGRRGKAKSEPKTTMIPAGLRADLKAVI